MKSYSKSSSFKSYKKSGAKTTTSFGIPGGGYLTDLSDKPTLPSLRDGISSITETTFAAALAKGEIDASAAYLDTKNKSIGVAGGISRSGGDVTLKGTTGDPGAGQERISMPLFGISPSMHFGGGEEEE